MVRLILPLLLLCASVCHAAISLSLPSITFTMAEETTDHAQYLTVTTTGAWTIASVAGSPTYLNDVNFSATSGTGTTTIRVWPMVGMVTYAAGTYTGGTITATQTSGGLTATINVTQIVKATDAYALYSNPGGIPDASLSTYAATTTSASFPYLRFADHGTIYNARPAGTFPLLTLGSSTTDPQFGTVYTRVSASQEQDDYSSRASINSNNTLHKLKNQPAGNWTYIRSQTTGALVYNLMTLSSEEEYWATNDPNRMYQIQGNVFQHFEFPSLTPVVDHDSTGFCTAPNTGGTFDVNRYDKVAVWCANEQQVCVFDWLNPSAAMVCGSTAAMSPAIVSVDSSAISKGFDKQGYLYVLLANAPVNLWWRYKPGDSSLTFYTKGPIKPDFTYAGTVLSDGCNSANIAAYPPPCWAEAHEDLCEDSDGTQWFVSEGYPDGPSAYRSVVWLRLDSLLDAPTSEAAGGGTRRSVRIEDNHFSCARNAPIEAHEFAQVIPGYTILAATNASPIVLTLGSVGLSGLANVFTNGESVLVGTAATNTAMNGAWTVGGKSGNNISLVGSTGNGTFTPTGYERVMLNVSPTTVSPGEGEIHIERDGGMQIMRMTHRSETLTDQANNEYFTQPKPNLSMDGTIVCWDTNWGVAGELFVACAPSGYSPNLKNRSMFTSTTGVTVDAGATHTMLRYTAPTPGTCAYTVSTSRNMSSPLVNSADAGGAMARTLSITTAASTEYWGIVNCANSYSARMHFVTEAAPGGTTQLSESAFVPASLSTANNCILNYGVTSGLGTSSSPVACSAGARVSVSISPSRDTTIFKQLVVRNSSNTALYTFGMTSQVVR